MGVKYIVPQFYAVQAWRKESGVPRWIVFVQGDNELAVDLDNALSVEAFTALLKSSDSNVLAEMLPDPEHLAVSGPDGAYVHEIVIPLASSTLAVLSLLVCHSGCLVFITFHLSEAVPSLAEDRRVCLLHFAADVSGERPVFDYLLRPGVSTQRLGMTLLRQEGVLDLLRPVLNEGHPPSEVSANDEGLM